MVVKNCYLLKAALPSRRQPAVATSRVGPSVSAATPSRLRLRGCSRACTTCYASHERQADPVIEFQLEEAGVRLAYVLIAASGSEVTWRTSGAPLAHLSGKRPL